MPAPSLLVDAVPSSCGPDLLELATPSCDSATAVNSPRRLVLHWHWRRSDLLGLAAPSFDSATAVNSPRRLVLHWRRSDLLELAAPGSVAARMRTTQRMMRSYAIYQQF